MKNRDKELEIRAEKLTAEKFEALGINKAAEKQRGLIKNMILTRRYYVYTNTNINKSSDVTMF